MKHTPTFRRELFALTVPIIIQNLLSTVVNSVDVMMLGYVGQTSLSAVSLANQVQFVLNLFFMGLTTGTVTMASQYWGRKDRASIRKVAVLAWKLSAAISSVFCLGAVLFPRAMMRIFTGDPQLVEIGGTYLRVIGFSYLFMALSQIYLCILKSVHQAVRSTVFASVTLLINVFLNAVFIFGWFGLPRLGVWGVAAATLSARFIEVLLCLFDGLVLKKPRFHFGEGKTDRDLQSRFLLVSLPVMGEGLVWGGATAVLSAIFGRLGSDIVAAHSIASVVQSIATVVCFGLAGSGGILLGRDLGQDLFVRARSHALTLIRFALVSGVLGCILMLAFRPLIMEFVSLTSQAASYLHVMFWVLALKVVLAAITNTMICGIFSAGGDTRFGLVCDLIVMWGACVVPGLLAAFVFHLPPIWVYLITQMDEILKLPFVIRHYRKEKWLRNLT